MIDFDEYYYIIKEIEFNNSVIYGLPRNYHIFPIITKEDFKTSFTPNIHITLPKNKNKSKKTNYSTRIVSTIKLNKKKNDINKNRIKI